MAVPAILLISELRKEVRALFIENELVEPLARYMPDANIVMVSSLAYDDTMDTAEEIGAKGFVFKPFEKDDLLKVLNDAVKDVPDAE